MREKIQRLERKVASQSIWRQKDINEIYELVIASEEKDIRDILELLHYAKPSNGWTLLLLLAISDQKKLEDLLTHIQKNGATKKDVFLLVSHRTDENDNILTFLLRCSPENLTILFNRFDEEEIVTLATGCYRRNRWTCFPLEAVLLLSPEQMKATLRSFMEHVQKPVNRIHLLVQLYTNLLYRPDTCMGMFLIGIYISDLLPALLVTKKDDSSSGIKRQLVSYAGKEYLKAAIKGLKQDGPNELIEIQGKENTLLGHLKEQCQNEDTLVYYVVNYDQDSGTVKPPRTTATSQLLIGSLGLVDRFLRLFQSPPSQKPDLVVPMQEMFSPKDTDFSFKGTV